MPDDTNPQEPTQTETPEVAEPVSIEDQITAKLSTFSTSLHSFNQLKASHHAAHQQLAMAQDAADSADEFLANDRTDMQAVVDDVISAFQEYKGSL